MNVRSIDRRLLRQQIRNQIINEAKTNAAKHIALESFNNPSSPNIVERLGKQEVKKIIDFIIINKLPLAEMKRSIETSIIEGEYTADPAVRDQILYEWGITRKSGVLKENFALEALFGFGPLLANLIPVAGMGVGQAIGFGGMIYYGTKAANAFDSQNAAEGLMHMMCFFFSAGDAGIPGAGAIATAPLKGLLKILSPAFKLIGKGLQAFKNSKVFAPIAAAIGKKLAANSTLLKGLIKLTGALAKGAKKAIETIAKINFGKIPLVGGFISKKWTDVSAKILPKIEESLAKSKLLGRLANKSGELTAENMGKVATAITAKGTKLEAEAAEMLLKGAKTADDPMIKLAAEMKLVKGSVDDIGSKMVTKTGEKTGKSFLALPKKAVEQIGELAGQLKFFAKGRGAKNLEAIKSAVSKGLGKGGKAYTNAVGDFTQGLLRMTDDFAKIAGTSMKEALKNAPSSLKSITVGKISGTITNFTSNKAGRFCVEITNKAGKKILQPIGGKTLEILKTRPKLLQQITADITERFAKAEASILKRAAKQKSVAMSKKAGAANAKAMGKVASEFQEALSKGNLKSIEFITGCSPKTMAKIATRGVAVLGSAMGEATAGVGQLPKEYKKKRTDETVIRSLKEKSLQILL